MHPKTLNALFALLCRAHLGEGRDPEWEKLHHDCEHVVYLAVSSAVKVG